MVPLQYDQFFADSSSAGSAAAQEAVAQPLMQNPAGDFEFDECSMLLDGIGAGGAGYVL